MCWHLKIPGDFHTTSKNELIEMLSRLPTFHELSGSFPADYFAKRLADMKYPTSVQKPAEPEVKPKPTKIQQEIEEKKPEIQEEQKEEDVKEPETKLVSTPEKKAKVMQGTFKSHVRRRLRRLRQLVKKESFETIEKIFLWSHVLMIIAFVVYMVFWSS